MKKQANHKNQQPELEASQQGMIELSEEQLEQVSGGADDGGRYALRGLTDIVTLGTAEIYWHSKPGKKAWSTLTQDDKTA